MRLKLPAFLIVGLFNLVPVHDAFSQLVQLTHRSRHKVLIIEKGERVTFVLKEEKIAYYASLRNSHREGIGMLTKIGKDSISVDSWPIAIKDLKKFGKRKRGSGLVTFLLAAGGGAAIAISFRESFNPCPTCGSGGSSIDAGRTGEILIGLSLLGLSVNTAIRNSSRDLETWNMEVLQFDKQ